MTQRSTCEVCQFPTKTCLCDYIEHVSLPRRVIVLQHPKEALHAKNTVRLLSLVSPCIEIVDSSNEHAIDSLVKSIEITQTAVFFPHTTSSEMESHSQTRLKKFQNLIFIDASWKQAYGIFMKNDWIKKCQLLHFLHPTKSRYVIRKSKMDNQLSTLEAVSYVLAYVHHVDVSPYNNIFEGLQANWLRFSAPNH